MDDFTCSMGVENDINLCFIELITDKSKKTLFKVIKQRILLGLQSYQIVGHYILEFKIKAITLIN